MVICFHFFLCFQTLLEILYSWFLCPLMQSLVPTGLVLPPILIKRSYCFWSLKAFFNISSILHYFFFSLNFLPNWIQLSPSGRFYSIYCEFTCLDIIIETHTMFHPSFHSLHLSVKSLLHYGNPSSFIQLHHGVSLLCSTAQQTQNRCTGDKKKSAPWSFLQV